MQELFSFNFPLREYFFCTTPAPPPISFLMVRSLEERFQLLKKSQLREDVRNSLQNRRFFQFRSFSGVLQLKKAVFTGIKIEPTKSGSALCLSGATIQEIVEIGPCIFEVISGAVDTKLRSMRKGSGFSVVACLEEDFFV